MSDDKIFKNLESFFENISIYYRQEFDFISDKIDSCSEQINSLLTEGLLRKADIYNLVIILEEVKYSTNITPSDQTNKLSQQIEDISNEIIVENEYQNVYKRLKILNRTLINYKNLIKDDFCRKIDYSKNKSFNETSHELMSKASFSYNYKDNIKDPLIKIYVDTFDLKNPKKLTKKYKDFFYKLKFFAKYNQNIKDFLPIDKNPVLSLLKLAYFIKNGPYRKQNLCNSDILLLRAFLPYNKDFKNLNLLNTFLESNSKFDEISFEDLIKNESSTKFSELKNAIDYGIFAFSQYFSDFDIKDILFPVTKQSILNSSSSSAAKKDNLETLNFPKIITDVDLLYAKLNKNKDIYISCFVKDDDSSNLEIILKDSPAKMLNDKANEYFYLLLEVSTTIRILTIKNDFSLLDPFISFERLFNDICLELSKTTSLNKDLIKHLTSQINKKLFLVNENYSALLVKENELLKKLSQNSTIPEDIHSLSYFLTTHENLSYKELLNCKKPRQQNIEKKLKQINKNIEYNKLKKANLIATETTKQILSNMYYTPPTLIGINNLPPCSNNVFLAVQKFTNNEFMNTIIERQENYWNI